MASLRIFSYLPNPRVWKSLIAGELCGVEVEVVGDNPANLSGWLWDFDAHALDEAERNDHNPNARTSRRGFSGTLYKTDAFLRAHPFGTVPAAFSADGSVGIFESNSILRAVARAADTSHALYGNDHYAASRIDSFLDATLVFAREAQVYLLAVDRMDEATHERMTGAWEFYMNGIEQALAATPFLAGSELTIADIGFACDLAQFLRERLMQERLQLRGFEPISLTFDADFPRVHAHLVRLAGSPAFESYLSEYLNQSLGSG